MTFRRSISSLLLVTLLLSLLMPAQSAASSCAADSGKSTAERVDRPKQRHGCSGCSARKAKARSILRTRTSIVDIGIAPRPALCCRTASAPVRAAIDVAVVPTQLQHVTVVALVAHPDLLLRLPDVETLRPRYLIGSSPPHLSATSRETWLRTAALLI